jgi:chromosomal replication initiator protein
LNNWSAILNEVSQKIDSNYYTPFIKPLELIQTNEGKYILKAPSELVKSHVEKKYSKIIIEAIAKVVGIHAELEIFVDKNDIPIANFLETKIVTEDLNCNQAFSFDKFFRSESNEQAYFIAKEILESNFHLNPIYFFGKVAVGKSHLGQAIAQETKRLFPNKRVIFIPVSDFLSEFVFSLQSKPTSEAFRLKYQSLDMLILDDLQSLNSSAEKTQEEFLNLFNHLSNKKKQIIILADRPISELPLNQKIKSRLESGYQTEIKQPDEKLRRKIIQSKLNELEFQIPLESIDLISNHFVSDTRSILGCINDLYMFKKTFSILLFDHNQVLDVLHHRFNRPKDLKQSHEQIIDSVCDFYKQTKKDILSKSRKAEFILPRHICMYLLHETVGLNKTIIGRMFSTKHTTVISAISKLKDRLKTDSNFKKEMERFNSLFGLR